MATIELLSEKKDQTALDVVFIHGLWGDARSTWEFIDPTSGGEYKAFWPKDLADDWPPAAVWTVGYDSSPTKWIGRNMPLLDRANSLLDLLDSHDIGARPVIFITHSLGGLLAKAIIRASADTPASASKASLWQNTRGVVFFSTPHTGSSIANLGKVIPGGRPTEILTELAENDAYLRNLQQWFSDKARELNYRCQTYFEAYKTNKVIVVDASSANPNCGLQPVPFDGDHYTVCKIPDRGDQRYRQVSRMIKATLPVGEPPQTPADETETVSGLDFEIGVLPNPPQDGRVVEFHPPARTLTYVSRLSQHVIKIAPKMTYLEQLEIPTILDPVAYYWNPFRCQFPSIDVTLVNNSPKTLVLSGATLEVTSSKPDLSPVIVVPSNTWGMELVIKNEGWGKISNAMLKCNLVPTGASRYMPDPPIDRIDIPSDFLHAFELGDFAESVTLNLREAIGAVGVDLKAIDDAGFNNQSIFAFHAMQNGEDVRMAKHLGRFPRLETNEAWRPFPDGYAVVVGLLEFDAVDRKGNPKRYSIPIRARVFLFNVRYDQPMPPSYQYSAELEPSGENYEVPIKLSQTLKSGEADRFTIRLACSQSATHHFRIRWHFVGGLSSVSLPIELQQFVPRSFANEEVEQVGAAAFDPELADVPTVFEGDCVEKTLMQMMEISAAMPSSTQGTE